MATGRVRVQEKEQTSSGYFVDYQMHNSWKILVWWHITHLLTSHEMDMMSARAGENHARSRVVQGAVNEWVSHLAFHCERDGGGVIKFMQRDGGGECTNVYYRSLERLTMTESWSAKRMENECALCVCALCHYKSLNRSWRVVVMAKNFIIAKISNHMHSINFSLCCVPIECK